MTFSRTGDGLRGSSDSAVKLCDSYSGERLLSLERHSDMVNVVEFLPDGQWVASAFFDKTVRI